MPQILPNKNKNFFEDTLPKYLISNTSLSLTPSELSSLASDIIQLSNLFTRDREILPPKYLNNEKLRRAYMLYYLPSNLYKIHLPLNGLSLHPKKILSKKKLKILDLGSGPGTTILGMLDFFSHQKKRPFLEFTAVDSIAENLHIAEGLFKLFIKNILSNASLKTFKLNIEKGAAISPDMYDIIILSNTLNELFHDDEKKIIKRVSFLNTILDKFLASDGSCIIIEPSLREVTRECLMVRDNLIKKGFHMYSPCLTDNPCPSLLNQKDWCHEDIPWDQPDIIKRLNKLTGLRKDSLKFSHLIVRKDKLSISDICLKNSYKVVSEPLVSKGKIEFFICNGRDRRLMTRLDKDKTPFNEQFQKLQRGYIVSCEALIDEGKRLKVGKDTLVSVATPSDRAKW
jgi:hypothetical protein